MPTVHLVHGFNISDGGASTTDKLIPYFEERGYTVVEHDSKWSSGILRDLMNVRYGNRKRAEAVAEMIQPDDLLVGHSNGCAIINIACWLLAKVNPEHRVRCMWLNPALDADSPISPIVSNFLVLHTHTDRVVQISKLLRHHRWGDMGRVGYKGLAGSKAMNCEYENLGLMKLGHSGVFKSQENLYKIMQAFDDWMEEI